MLSATQFKRFCRHLTVESIDISAEVLNLYYGAANAKVMNPGFLISRLRFSHLIGYGAKSRLCHVFPKVPMATALLKPDTALLSNHLF